MFGETRSSEYEQLIQIVRQVRNRWRMRVALGSAAVVVALALAAVVLSAYGMDYYRYGIGAVTSFRVFFYLALVGATLYFFVLPLLRRVSDEQVALYIEEHDLSLKQALISAVEMGGESDTARGTDVSSSLVKRLVASAVEKCQGAELQGRIERRSLVRALGAVAAVAALSVSALVLSPGFLRHSASLLLIPWRNALAASPYSISVAPGDAEIARGSDQMIGARLVGFDADRVEIGAKTADAEKWQRWPMAVDEETGEFMYMFFDLQDQTEYFVEASGVRSPIFALEVVDIPFVERIDLEYHFPEYTGLAPRTVEDGGDIAALRGTEVRILATPTVEVAGGRILVDEADPIEMEKRAEGGFSGTMELSRDGFYKIELDGLDGTRHTASPEFTISVLADLPPAVSFVKPGRDSKVTTIEEVFTEMKADDDYGIGKAELVFSVNGGEDQIITLYSQPSRPQKEFSAGHTFFLEELELEPGDFISYFGRASDTDRIEGSKTTTTDIYFIEVRPFGRTYRQAQQGMMGGGGGGGGMDGGNDALAARQRQIVAATFKLIRDRGSYSSEELQENLTTVAVMQGRLREQVETLLRRMTNRGFPEAGSDFGTIADSLRQAAEEMVPAEEELLAFRPDEALPPEQRALKHLQRAEAVFQEVQVAFGQGGGGGGGGGGATAEELADLFELELDKLRNQYETVERGQRQAADNQIDEALQRLQELARRQQQENERMRRRAAELQTQAGRGNAGQSQLAEETEELARRLERLAREESLPELMDTARRLRDAADSMRRGAASGSEQRLAEGISALDRLKDARRLLDKKRTARVERDVEDALSRAQRLADQQEKVMSEIRELGGGGAERDEQMRRLLERKDEMETEVADLETQMDRVARESRDEQREAARKLQEAANSIRENKLKEKIRYSKGVVQGRSPEYAEKFEEQVRSDIGELVEKIRDAAGAVGQSEEAQVADALDDARELLRNMESLGERIRDQQETARRLGNQAQQEQQQSGGESSPGGEQQQQGGEQQGGEQQGQGGQRGGEQQPGGERGGFDRRGGPGGTYWGGGYQPGIYSSEDIRQYRREFDERVRDAERLRDRLRSQDLEVPDLQSIIDRMRAFDSRQILLDPRGFEELHGSLLEELKQFEYWLRREMEGISKEKLFLASSDQVPPEFRELVEEYYRSLSREPQP